MTLLIDTRVDPPNADWVKEQHLQGFEVIHLPALEVLPLQTTFDLTGAEAVFLASPRAVSFAIDQLKLFKGPLWTVGQGTANALIKYGLEPSIIGNGEGALSFLNSIRSRFAGIIPISVLAWLSAEETAADLNLLASEFHIEIRHIPVYRTIEKKYDISFINSLTKRRKWLFYSGRALESLRSFISDDDEVVCYGRSAEQKKKNLH